MMKAHLVRAAVLGLPGLALAEEVRSQTYACDRGVVVQASYVTIAERSFAVLSVEGRHLAFDIATSASGVRHVAMDATQPYVWWTKGDTASLWFGPPRDEAVIHDACRVQTAP